MKILFLTSSFYPSIGGVEKHVLKVTEELVKRGHTVTILTELKPAPKHSGGKSDSEAIKSKKVEESRYFIHKKSLFSNLKLDQTNIYYFKFPQPGFFKKFIIWYYLLRNFRLIRNVDVVHCHDVFIWYLPFRFLFFKKPVFTTFHGYEGRFPPVEKSILIRNISEKLSQGNICVGDFISRWYRTRPNYVVYGGVDEVNRAKITLPRKRLIKILLIGRLEKDIGVHMYFEALRNLKRQGVQFEFIACGDGKLRHKLEKYGKVLGFVKNTKEYIKNSDIVFASSYLTMLSVMQMGKPVFAVYTNPLKHDYLYSSPFSRFIYIYSTGKELAKSVKNYKPNMQRISSAQKWANQQTWGVVADVYEHLWGK